MTVTLHGSVGDGGQNNETDVQAVQNQLVALGFGWVVVDGAIGPQTIGTIKLFQAITRGNQKASGAGVDGRVDVDGFTHKWLNAANAPRWQKMLAGSRQEGFENFELTDPKDDHEFGTDWLNKVIQDAGANYRDNHLNTHPGKALITVNDASKPRGGDTPDHSGHETGLCCDLRLPKTDGKAGGITWQSAQYDRDAMRAILQAFKAQALVDKILFNDTALIAENLCVAHSGHDNHVHIEIQLPERVA